MIACVTARLEPAEAAALWADVERAYAHGQKCGAAVSLITEECFVADRSCNWEARRPHEGCCLPLFAASCCALLRRSPCATHRVRFSAPSVSAASCCSLQCVVRVSAALRAKPTLQDVQAARGVGIGGDAAGVLARKPWVNPFLPYDKDLYVRHLVRSPPL